MLISTALLLDSIIRNSVCTPAKLPCRRVAEGSKVIMRNDNEVRVCPASERLVDIKITKFYVEKVVVPSARKI
jgi:hypothetical protein